jgi:LPS-assembly protein
VSLGTEFRYLEPHYLGSANLDLMPNDTLTDARATRSTGDHEAALIRDTSLAIRVLRVSDDDYWKDFPAQPAQPRRRGCCCPDMQATRTIGDWTTYARVDALAGAAEPDEPDRPAALPSALPQIGAAHAAALAAGRWSSPSKANSTASPTRSARRPDTPTGSRVHTLASLARPWATPGWTLTPRLTLNAAAYSLDRRSDGRRTAIARDPDLQPRQRLGARARRTLVRPRAAPDAGAAPALRQHAVPRPDRLPNFDSAGKDFNFESIYTENASPASTACPTRTS